MKPLEGKVALVTGASRGVGRGIALELGAAGATVYITARSIEEPQGYAPGTAQAVVGELKSLGARAVALRCDHADDEQTREVIAQIDRAEGRLDILVNNAFATPDLAMGPTIEGGKAFWEAPLAAWDQMLNVGQRSHFIATALAMPLLLKTKGLVVNISSAAGQAYFYSVHYGVQKSGVDRMIRDMAYEVGKGGVSFVALWPGWVSTEVGRMFSADRVRINHDNITKVIREARGGPAASELTDEQILNCFEDPRFTGRAVVALACDANVNQKTGQCLSVVGLAHEYGFDDVSGRRPDPFGFMDKEVWTSLAH